MPPDYRTTIISTFGTQRWNDPEMGWSARITKDKLFIDAKGDGRLEAELWKIERLFVGLGFFKASRLVPAPPLSQSPKSSAPVESLPLETSNRLFVDPGAIPEVPAIKKHLELLTRYVNTTPIKRPINGKVTAPEPEPELSSPEAAFERVTDPPIIYQPVLFVQYKSTLPARKARDESVLHR